MPKRKFVPYSMAAAAPYKRPTQYSRIYKGRKARWNPMGRFRLGGPGRRFLPRALQGGGELKFFDSTSTATLTGPSPGMVPLTSIVGMAQGAGDSERVGKKVVIRSLFAKVSIVLPAAAGVAAGLTSEQVRIIIVQDQQNNGSTPTAASFSAAYLVATGASTIVGSFRNLDNTGRYITLYDKVHTVNANNPIVAAGLWSFGNSEREIHITKPKLAIPLEFTGAAGGAGSLTTNNVFCYAVGNNGNCTVAFQCRVRYSDD